MGSRRYALRARERNERIAAMFSLETIGWYSEQPGSQRYPFPLSFFYPSTGNFLAFVSNLGSRALLHESLASFRRQAKFPSEGVAAPALIPGVDWSDHASFWEQGYPALMLTDTAPYRYPHYHSAADTPDKVDYERLARVVSGLEQITDPHAGATDSILVRRTDAATGGADLALTACGLASLIEGPVHGQDHVRAIRDAQALARNRHALRLEPRDLGEQHLRIDDDARADHVERVLAQDARWDQMQDRLLALHDERVSSVRAALEPRDELRARAQMIDDLALALVAPLGADADDVRHGATPRPRQG